MEFAEGTTPRRAQANFESRRHTRRLLCSHVILRMSADVHDARLGLCLSWRLRLCRKLKHRCLLTLMQVRQENKRAIRKFECVVMHLWYVLVDLSKDRRPGVGHESPSLEFGAERPAHRHDHCRALDRWAPWPQESRTSPSLMPSAARAAGVRR